MVLTSGRVRARVEEARRAGRALAGLPGERRSRLLRRWADALQSPQVQRAVQAANAADVREAEAALGAPSVQRLRLDGGKLDGLADGLRQLAALPDQAGAVSLRRELDEGLVLERVLCPLGVLAVVFEARPDALVQVAGLAVRTGNAAVLKGGREARRTNEALGGALREVIAAEGLDPAALTLLAERSEVAELLGLPDLVDLVVARGSAEFVAGVRAASRIPVLAHAAGVCHLYVHRSARPEMAARLAVDAKTTYAAACNSIETLLWDEGAGGALARCVEALGAAGVELRGCPATRARHPGLAAAAEADWGTEYGGLVLAVRQVDGIEAALRHVEAHGSRHTEAIVAEDLLAAERFLREVDAANVFWNASTRFADGYRYGLGAEVGISTDKLHARGPVGADGLLTYRWILRGAGHRTADYGPGGRPFTHRDLPR